MVPQAKKIYSEPIRATASGNRIYLGLKDNAGPGQCTKHEAFIVNYRWISEVYRSPVPLTVYVGRQGNGQIVVAALSALRVGFTENDLNELAHLCFYFWPNGNPDPKNGKICQPVGMWLFSRSRMLLACLEGTEKKPLQEWLMEAKKEQPDPGLYGVAASYRRRGRTVALAHKRKKPAWRLTATSKPLQSFHPFRYKESLKPALARPAGVLVGAAVGSGPSRGRHEPPVDAKKPDATRLDLPDRSDLHKLGYRIGGLSRRERWQVLADEGVPRLGLEKVVRTIENHRRRALSQSSGSVRYAHAIGEWEYDLACLKREIYPNYRPQFVWPRSER